MTQGIAVHVVRASELGSISQTGDWDDPDGLATPPPRVCRMLLTNPFVLDDEPVQLVGTFRNRVAGHLYLTSGRVNLESRELPILWTFNLLVPPEHRKTMMAVMIIMKAQSLGRPVAACGVSRLALPLLLRLRWTDFRLPRLVRLRRSRALIEKFAGGGAGARMLSNSADMALVAHSAFISAWTRVRTRGLRCQRVEAMTEELDEQIRTSDEPIACHRSAAWVNWWLQNDLRGEPRDRRELFYVFDRSQRVVAYFITTSRFYETATHREFKNLQLGSLKDWMILDRTAVGSRDIALLASRELERMDVDAIEVCVPDRAQSRALRKLGFVHAGDLHFMYKARASSPLADERWAAQDQWRIRPAEADNYFV